MDKELRAAMLAQVEARRAYNALPEDAEDKDVAEARTKLEDADNAVADLLAKEPASAPAELRDRISLARYLRGIVEQRTLDGAEGELRAELKLGDQAVPLEALMPTPEERADAVSPQDGDGDALSYGDVYKTTGPMLGRVFTKTDTMFLGVSMPTVPPGERTYPVMVDGTTAAMRARGAAGPDAGAAKFDVVNATPKRLTGSYVFDLEGVATLGGMLESTLRNDLRTVLGYQMDLQVLNGTGASGQVSGLKSQLDLGLPPGAAFDGNNVNAVIDWDKAKDLLTGSLDGKHARSERDVRLLFGKASYQLLRKAYRGTTTENQDAWAMMAALGASLGLSFQIAAPANATVEPKTADGNKAVQDCYANFERGAAVAPVWQGITIVRDPFSEASKAQVKLTAHMLFDFVLRRKDGWKRYAIRTQA
ncbi:MAG: phage major capsid protein [Gammaproteobacteria bacterium]|nr:phage major capsid protein [Gammaproteobacteria bacterium]